MKPARLYRCDICGATPTPEGWYLVAEDRERDTLQILKWSSRLAEQPGMRHLCSAAHVEELVSHWMVSGSLDYGRPRTDYGLLPSPVAGDDSDASYRLGELTLDRASFAALGERPDMLHSILDAIDGALHAAADLGTLEEEPEDEEEPAYDA